MTSYDDARKETLAALEAGDAQAAFDSFRPALEFPTQQLHSRERWQDALRVFADVTTALGGDKLAHGLLILAHNPDEPRLLVGLGKRFIDEGIPAVAATFLARANELSPGDEGTLPELAMALERTGQFRASCDFLRAASEVVERSALCRYLLAFHALMTGNLGETRSLLPGLFNASDPHGVVAPGVARLVGMLRRADAVRDVTPLDQHDLRGWHFVVTGGLLLHRSPHGPDEMNGRYAFVQDGDAVCLEGIRRVEAVLRTWGVKPPRVFVLPDRDSAILGRATARVLDMPAEPWPDAGSEAPGLIVAYDLDNVDPELSAPLSPHRPGQVLWCHAASWTSEAPFAADLTTYLYQINTSPWGPRMRVEGDAVTWTEPAAGSVEELAAGVTAAELTPDALGDVEQLQSLAAAAAKVSPPDGPGAFRMAGHRPRQYVGSPVPSARFD